MQIKIEIDVKPEELRRFLGLPDVAGLQEDVLHFLREKLGAASESFDPASFVKDNLQTIRNSGTWKKFVAAAKARTTGLVPEAAPAAKKRARVRPAGARPRPRPAAAKARKQQETPDPAATGEAGVSAESGE
jgi:hypothetical protein